MALNPDGQSVFIGFDDGLISEFDLNTGAEVRTLVGHQSDVLSLDVKENRVISGSQAGTLILWDRMTGELLREWSAHNGGVSSVAFNSDGTQALSGGRDSQLILWDVTTGTEIRRFVGHTGSVYSVAFSPDDRYALSGGRDTFVMVWDVQTGHEVARLAGHSEAVWSIAFSPDGTQAVSGSADAIVLWNLKSFSEVQRYTPAGIPLGLAFDPAGQQIVSGDEQGVLQTWNLFTLDRLISWVEMNRYVRDLTCIERDLYRVEPYCTE
jgi:WD40 repeat protein